MPRTCRAFILLITLAPGCRTAGPSASPTVNEPSIDRGCLALTYADSTAAATLPPTLRLTGRRSEPDITGQRWYAAVVREGAVRSSFTPPDYVIQWHPLGTDSAVVERTELGGAVTVFRLRVTAPAAGTVERREKSGAPREAVLFTAEKSLACYPFQL